MKSDLNVPRQSKAPLVVGLILFIFSLLVWQLTQSSLKKRNEALFESYGLQVEQQLTSRMETYINALMQTRSMFHVTREVDQKEFRAYVHDMELLSKYPGIQGVGFTLRLNPRNLKAHPFWPDYPREDYFTILYLEPLNWRNKRAIGYDMFTDPIRRAAMERARDTGLPAMSATVELVQETTKSPQKGFLIYVPVYENGSSTEVTSDRQKSLYGFVYSPFRTNDLFKQILSPFKDFGLDVEIKIGPEKSLLKPFDHPEREKTYAKTFTVALAQQPWEVRVVAGPEFNRSESEYLPWIILFLGTLVSVLAGWILHQQVKDAALHEEKSAQLDRLNQVGQLLSAELNLEKLIQSVTDIGLDLSGAEFGAFFYNTVDAHGDAFMLYSLSGAKREEFEKFPYPRATEVFGPTFRGEGTVISDDITKDPKYGRNDPYYGMPKGHLPVRSYLAVPVISRSGEVIGGLFYGHSQRAVFGAKEQNFIEGIASQAAIAIDNARLYKKAQDAIETRDEFLNIASHELKTPITSMKLQFQTALRMIDSHNDKVYEKSAVMKRVKSALNQLDRMNKLIDDMLDSSRVSLAKLELKKEPVDVERLVHEVVERFREQFSALGITLEVNNPTERLVVLGDEYRLEQVLSNLLSNAIKYGDGKPVALTLSKLEGFATIKVQDHGLGISPQSLPHIFQRYERAVSASNISGLGLGLYISHKIVEGHSGRIDVESDLGKGSLFTVFLPLS